MAHMDKYKKVSLSGGAILGIIITFIIIGGLIFLMIPTEKERIYKEYSAASSTLPVNHNLNEVSLKKLTKEVKKMDDDEFLIVYFGYSGCSNCVQQLGNIVTKTRDVLKVEEVLYLKSNDNEGDPLVKKSDLVKAFGNEEIGDKTPEIWVFKGGELLVSTVDYFNKDEETISWDTFWLRVEHEMGLNA